MIAYRFPSRQICLLIKFRLKFVMLDELMMMDDAQGECFSLRQPYLVGLVNLFSSFSALARSSYIC